MRVIPAPEIGDPLPPLDALAIRPLAEKTSRYGEPWLHNEVARRMAQRLALIRHPVAHWVHWAPRSGGLASQDVLEGIFPKANSTVVQTQATDLIWASQALKRPWWRRWLGPQRRFGMQAGDSADMVWSNMGLHMQARPVLEMQRWAHSLKDDGFVMFSCLGPDTLRELRSAYESVGWAAPAHEFTDMHDWGDMLVQAGFAEPVMDMERMTLTYESPERLLSELRELGRNFSVHRFGGLRGRGWLAQMKSVLETLAQPDHGGRLVLTFEIIYTFGV